MGDNPQKFTKLNDYLTDIKQIGRILLADLEEKELLKNSKNNNKYDIIIMDCYANH